MREIGVKALCCIGRVACLVTFISLCGPGDFSGGKVCALRELDNAPRKNAERDFGELKGEVPDTTPGGAEG